MKSVTMDWRGGILISKIVTKANPILALSSLLLIILVGLLKTINATESHSMTFQSSETSLFLDQQTSASILGGLAEQELRAAKRSIYDPSLNRHLANGDSSAGTFSPSSSSSADVDYTNFEASNDDRREGGQHQYEEQQSLPNENRETNHGAIIPADEMQIPDDPSIPSAHTTNLSAHMTSSNHHHHQYEELQPTITSTTDPGLQQFSPKNFLTRGLIHETCELDRGSQREEHIQNIYLAYCSRYKLDNLLSSELLDSIMHGDTKICSRVLDEFVQLDEVVEQFDRLFLSLLTRYNCHNGYSVKWSCDDCKRAYTDWICATHLPFYMNAERIKPCISVCERVEQRCPYLHPITREQYGGQPVFICQDPNIPFMPKITPEMPYNEQGQCYDLCHLSDNLTELITDSLSKYDYDKCPDKNSIAGLVQANPHYCGSACAEQHQLKRIDIHKKKLDELREVLANYKNQAKTHRYHADHSSLYQQHNSNWSI